MLGTDDSGWQNHGELPAPWGAVLFGVALVACVAYGYGRGHLRAMWTGTWVIVLAVVALEVVALRLCAGDVCHPDPDDPVISPLTDVLFLPTYIALIALGVVMRR